VATAGCSQPLARLTRTEVYPPPTVAATTKEVIHVGAAPSSANACRPVDVHFAVDSAQLEPRDKPRLDRAAACLTQNQAAQVIIRGRADETGSDAHNLALGRARAKAVASYLLAQGAAGPQVRTVSTGESEANCPGDEESCRRQFRSASLQPICRPM
jgi:outer membrane protein OmpA-like peptidoglycan-associated protein